MPTFSYKARNPAGQLIQGSMNAQTKDELSDKLRHMGLMPTHVQEAIAGLSLDFLFRPMGGVKTEDMLVWNIQFANLINSGINVMSALDALQEQTDNWRLKRVTQEVLKAVDGGESFSEALCYHPKVFSNLFLSMVQAGEASGKLDNVLTNYASYIERQHDLKQKLSGALYYPAFLLVGGIAVITYVVMAIVPEFVEIFMAAGVELPWPTRFSYDAAYFMRANWFSMAVIMSVLCFLLTVALRTKSGAYLFDRLKLRIPVLGTLFLRAAVARFARTLGTLVASGVSILKALEISRGVVGNEVIARCLDQTRSDVEKGERIAPALKRGRIFPADAIHMISVGEESGSLDVMLGKIATFYDRYLGYAFKRLTTVLEPILLCVMGGMVAFIMLSTMLPMLDMVTILRK